MAKAAFLKALFGVFPGVQKSALYQAADFLCDRNWRFGPPGSTRSENMAGVFVQLTTSSVSTGVVSVAHGLGKIPDIFWPVGNPRVVNSFLPRLSVPRAADATRLYVTSPDTAVTCSLYVE